MTGFQTQAETVSAHGKLLVGQVSPSLQEAVSASQVSLGPNVMGELCQAWSWIFNEELDDAKALLAALPKAFEATVTNCARRPRPTNRLKRATAPPCRG